MERSTWRTSATATTGGSLDVLSSPRTQRRVTRLHAHRPWPMPRRSWVMAQTWMDLLFAHWGVTPQELARVVPPQLSLDTFDGRAWISVTPFEIRNLRMRGTLPVPALSRFTEINVRTYVTYAGKPGIYFFSLDADSALAVVAARRLYRLPYFRARMSISRADDEVRYASERSERGDSVPRASFRADYRPAGAAFHAAPGTLEHWLTERYCLYTLDGRERVLRAEIHHPPWPLQAATADLRLNTMAAEIGMELSEQPLLHFARRQDVVFWALQRAKT